MLQRIQTLYFLAAMALAVVTACVRVGRWQLPDGGIVLWGSVSWWPLLALLIVVAVLLAMTTGLYKHRLLQVRGATMSSLLLVGWYALFFWHGFFTHSVLDAAENYVADIKFAPQWTAALPAVAVIFLIAGIRATLRDEALVRSLDRLR